MVLYGFAEPLKSPNKNWLLEDVETKLKTYGPIKNINIFTSYLEAQKTPQSRLLRLNPPWLRRPLKLNRRSRYLW